MKLCGDGPSATEFKSQAAWAGGVGKIGGKGQKTQVVGLVAAVFPFPPSGSFQGLKMLLRLVSVFLVVGLSFSEKIQPRIKGTQGRKM